MKKFVKGVCLTLVLSLMMGTGGCAMMIRNMVQEQPKEEVKPLVEIGWKDETEVSEKEKGSEIANNKNGSANQTATQGPSKADEELMSEYFVSKMELLMMVIDQYYMNDISVEDMRTGAYKGLLEGLGDPYTCYYTEEEFDALMESTSGTYYGIGAVVQQNLKTMYITIVKPYVTGPAYKAGMLPGDIIYMVDGVDVTGMDINKVVAMMKGPEGTEVKVTVVREGVTDPIELTITRAKIEIETIEYEMLEDQIGYILISGFEEPTPKQFKEAITNLKKQGMKGLVLDLRDNGGGLLDAVVEMLDYILPEGMIVYTEDKYGNREEYKGTNKDVLELPMAVLVNGNSASASEIFAAALQDYKAATLIGTTTFGKGIVQTILPLTDGTAVKITISRYFTPNGVCIHGKGVTPDIMIELNDELRQMVVIPKDQDNQLEVAVNRLINEIYEK